MLMPRSRIGHLFACQVLLIFASVVSAQAGVSGNRYAGTFVTNLGFPAACTLSFAANGELTEWENGILFGGVYTGPYTEVDLGGVTYWRSVVADESPNGFATFSGFSVFGIVTTFHNQNLDQGITADGLLIRTGAVADREGEP